MSVWKQENGSFLFLEMKTKKGASCKACSNKKTWRIEKSPTPESLRLQLESHLHKC